MNSNLAAAGAANRSLPRQFVELLERFPGGAGVKDAAGRYVYANPFLAERCGVAAWIGKATREVHPGEGGRELAEIDLRVLRGESVESECRLADASGSLRTFRVSKFPMRTDEGEVLIACLLNDVTALKEEAAALAAALDAKDALLKEVYHRVKNNLATVASLLSLEAGAIRDERAVRAFEDCQSRIHSMALVHEALYGSGDLERLDFGPYLAKIAELLVDAAGAAPRVRLELEAGSLPLESAIAMPLGLIANELLTNALKYAFPAGRSGRIALSLARRPEGAVLAVADDGVGLPEGLDPAAAPSLGLQLVRVLAAQIGARVEFGAGPGFSCKVVIPS